MFAFPAVQTNGQEPTKIRFVLPWVPAAGEGLGQAGAVAVLSRGWARPAPQGLSWFPRIILLFYVYLMNTVIWQNVAVRNLWVPEWATQHHSVGWLQKSAGPQSLSHKRWCQPHGEVKYFVCFPLKRCFTSNENWEVMEFLGVKKSKHAPLAFSLGFIAVPVLRAAPVLR